MGWRGGGGVVDMAVAPSFNQLVGASLSAAVVTTYIADVKSCVPFTSPCHHLRSHPPSPSSPRNRRLGIQDLGSSGGDVLTPIPLPSTDEVSWRVLFGVDTHSSMGSFLENITEVAWRPLIPAVKFF